MSKDKNKIIIIIVIFVKVDDKKIKKKHINILYLDKK